MYLIASRHATFFRNKKPLFLAVSSLLNHWRLLLLVCCCIQLSAQTFAQNITLSEKKAPLKKVLENIKKQSGYSLFYEDKLLQKSSLVDISVKNATLIYTLDRVFDNQPLSYEIVGNKIISIKEKSNVQRQNIPIQANYFIPSTIIRGTVKNEAGEPLDGATVKIKNENISTFTKPNGMFEITIPEEKAVLMISYIGYQAQELPTGGQTEINIVMRSETAPTTEVVVIGYQTVRRKDLTGASVLVNTANSNKVTTSSVGESIQGLVPGVTVRNSGVPGGNSVIEIRGVASFTNNNPLYVIDGMIADANSTVNTDDVESIQVLKDASAAAIYGSRAASGVIIITTKKGKNGPSKVFFSAKYGAQKIPNRWDVMDAASYVATVKTQYQNSNVPLPAGIATSKFNTDWQDQVYRTGSDQDYNIGVSGGSAAGNYLMSASYYKNQGVIIGNDFERAALRINTQAKKGIVTIGENLMLSNTIGRNPGGGINAFYEAPQSLPIIPVKDPSYNTIPANPAGWGFGSTDIPSYATNYVANVALDKVKYNFAKLMGNAFLDIKLTNWLNYRFNAGLEVSFDYTKEIRDTGIWRFANQVPGTSVGENRSQFTNLLLEHTLNFNKSFGKHNINGVVGYTYQQYRTENTSGGRLNLLSANGQTYTTITSATGSPSAGSYTDLYRLQGYLGRVNYNYNDKYLVTLTGRIDQNSKFGKNYRQGEFYSAAAAWRISQENFFHAKWISDLKLRASYGKLGISSALDAFGSWPGLGVINSNPRAVYGVGQTPLPGAYQAQITNPDLRWEDRFITNIGFDASLFHNTILVTAEVYNSLSKNLIVGLPLGMYLGSGGGNPAANVGSIRNRGIELSVGYRHNTGDIKWDVSVNGTAIQNRIVSVGNQGAGKGYLDAGLTRSAIGQSVATWYLLQTNGIFQNQQEIDNYKNKAGKIIQPLAKPGDIKYVDNNGDGQINNDDRAYLGGAFPKFQGGAQFNASYMNFNLNIQLVGLFGNKIYNGIRRNLDSYQLTNFRSDISPWTTSNTNTTDPRLGLETGDPGITSNNIGNTDRWLENGSYLRLRNVELGYTFTKKLLGNIGFTGARIYISGQNLLTLTKYSGLDPDAAGNGILERGYDNGNWPASRRFSAGIQCDF